MRPGSTTTIAGLQLDFSAGERRAERIERVIDAVKAAPAADLIVLPELWDVAYFAFDDYAREAEPLDAGPVARLAEVAAARHCTIVAGSVIERDDDRLHNTAAVVGPDGTVAGTYRKTHLFRYGSREGELLSPGNGPSVATPAAGGIGLATCFDLRFP